MFRKEPFFYGHDNYDQLVKIAKVNPKSLNFTHMQQTMASALFMYAMVHHLSTVSTYCCSEPRLSHSEGSLLLSLGCSLFLTVLKVP